MCQQFRRTETARDHGLGILCTADVARLNVIRIICVILRIFTAIRDICRHTQYGGGHEISQAYRPARHVFLCRFPSFQSRTSRRQDVPPDTQFLRSEARSSSHHGYAFSCVCAPNITVIIGNFLDNALQAVEKLPSPLRKILVLLKYDKGRLFIKVENSFDGKVKKKDGHIETMKSEIGHGYGLKKCGKSC